MSAPSEYPGRPRFWAHKFCRLLTKTEAAQQLGPECCWLLAVIVHQEDAIRYQRAVSFWNDQLLPLCGFGSRKRLETARTKAIDAGFLHYEPGCKGRPGRYWVTTPRSLAEYVDGPVCEPELRDETERNSSLNCSTSGTQTAGQTENHSSLCPSPVSPTPRQVAEKLLIDLGMSKLNAKRLAQNHDLPTIAKRVEQYQANRNILTSPGAIATVLEEGEWPANVEDVDTVRRKQESANEKRRRDFRERMVDELARELNRSGRGFATRDELYDEVDRSLSKQSGQVTIQ